MTTKPFGQLLTMLALPALALWHGLSWLNAVQHRERTRLIEELSQTRGLMQLLMKQRNGYRWSESDRREIRRQLRNLASLGPYMVLFVSPGGFFALPVLAWWLDRRRQKRADLIRRPSVE